LLVTLGGDRSFDDAWVAPQPTVGHEVVQDVSADGADEVDDGVGDDAGGLDELVAGGAQGDGEAARRRDRRRAGAIVASMIAMRSVW